MFLWIIFPVCRFPAVSVFRVHMHNTYRRLQWLWTLHSLTPVPTVHLRTWLRLSTHSLSLPPDCWQFASNCWSRASLAIRHLPVCGILPCTWWPWSCQHLLAPHMSLSRMCSKAGSHTEDWVFRVCLQNTEHKIFACARSFLASLKVTRWGCLWFVMSLRPR